MVDVLRKKKKKWIPVLATKEFNNIEIGETLVAEKEAVGRVLRVSLMNLSGELKKQHVKIKFRINDVKEGKANTEIVGYEIVPAYVRRLTKRAKSKIDDSFTAVMKDNVKIRIKPLVLTKNKAKGSVLTKIRKMERDFFLENLKKLNYDDFVKGLIYYKLQREIKEKLKRIYPIMVCEVRVFKREK